MDPFKPAHAWAEDTRSGRISCSELVDFYIRRIEAHDGALNAVVVRDFDRARMRARMLDSLPADQRGALFGVPMTVKESFDLQGHPTTWGFHQLAGGRAARDALAVQRLEAAGAVVMGKSNVPVALADWQCYNPIYGSTNNPWNAAHTPGGSSGGAAAAMAAGQGALELGSDIGGSIRVPAHFCGVFGHKPSWGLCSGRGHSPMPSHSVPDISVIGPIARSAQDLDIALALITGPDPEETDSAGMALPAPRLQSPHGLRVAVWAEQPGQATQPAVREAVLRAADVLAARGAQISTTARPGFDPVEAFHVYLMLLNAALSGRMMPAALERQLQGKALLADDDMRADAVMLRAAGMSHREWLMLNERRCQMRKQWGQFFRDWDVLLCPPLGSAALPHRQDGETWERRLEIDGQDIAYNDLLFWPGITCGFHLPATVAPAGFAPDGLPVGVQIAGPMFGDRLTIAVAGMLEEALGGFVAPPGFG